MPNLSFSVQKILVLLDRVTNRSVEQLYFKKKNLNIIFNTVTDKNHKSHSKYILCKCKKTELHHFLPKIFCYVQNQLVVFLFGIQTCQKFFMAISLYVNPQHENLFLCVLSMLYVTFFGFWRQLSIGNLSKYVMWFRL